MSERSTLEASEEAIGQIVQHVFQSGLGKLNALTNGSERGRIFKRCVPAPLLFIRLEGASTAVFAMAHRERWKPNPLPFADPGIRPEANGQRYDPTGRLAATHHGEP